MKKIKKISAIAMAMALTVGSCVSVYAASPSPSPASNVQTYSGTIADGDLTTKLTYPTSSTLVIKPYSGEQITTPVLYFKNTEDAAENTGDDIVSYKVSLAGYTCVATSASTDNPIKVAATLPTTGTAKNITAKIELGTAIDTSEEKATGETKEFKATFNSAASLDVAKLSETSYDGSASSTYTKNTATEGNSVTIEPQKSVPFRITGTMNTSANWEIGDTITIVPVFSMDVVVTQKQ